MTHTPEEITALLKERMAAEMFRLIPDSSEFVEYFETTEYEPPQHDGFSYIDMQQRPQKPEPVMEQRQEQQSQQMQQGGHGGGGVFKVEHLKVKVGRVLAFAAGAAATLVAASSNPILFIVAFVGAGATLLDMSNAQLTENEASIVWTMSKSEYLIHGDNLRKRTAEERKLYGLSSLTEEQFLHALDRLIALGCVEREAIFSFRLLDEFTFSRREYT